MKTLLFNLGKAVFPHLLKLGLKIFLRTLDTVEERHVAAVSLAGKLDLPGDLTEEEEIAFIETLLQAVAEKLLEPLIDEN